MSSPSMVQKSGDTLIVRSVVSGDRLFLESGENASSDRPESESPPAADDSPEEGNDLPQCKIKRNYDCVECDFFTQNPRHYLTHLRDVHGEKVKIYSCPSCLYASRHYQKLLRHTRMVHGMTDPPESSIRAKKKSGEEPSLEEKFDGPTEEIKSKSANRSAKSEMKCSVCDFVATSYMMLTKHERKEHLKAKYFPCSKCNYATHIKARFTKHVKYHSMPMIKCEVCDFRTPYKWNLDRHMKNHGGTGAFCCSVCNFTADIKQSLTVHEMNHHVPAIGTVPLPSSAPDNLKRRNTEKVVAPRSKRRRLRHYTTATIDDDTPPATSDVTITATDTSLQNVQQADEKYVENNNDDTNSVSKIDKKPKKTPRPIPNLIPLHLQNINGNKNATNSNPVDINVTEKVSVPNCDQQMLKNAKNIGKKKSSSIFDKLYKEKMIAVENNDYTCKDCGEIFRSFSEYTLHERSCVCIENKSSHPTVPLSGLGSTRCQHCRHRCKSSSDLIMHLKTCLLKNKPEDSEQSGDKIQAAVVPSLSEEDTSVEAPHPMENVVFVWNRMINNDISLNSEINTDSNKILTSTPNQEVETTGKKVFKCPHCSFFATTASRFHVHIVGHLNKKPFECSLCSYKSNWRWDITKHIRLKSVRDPEHAKAKVLMTDETGRRNYTKYNKYLTFIHNSDANLDAQTASLHLFNRKSRDNANSTQECDDDALEDRLVDEHKRKRTKKSMWKCKKCDYRNASKDALLVHVRVHLKSSTIETSYEDPEDMPASEVIDTSDASSLLYRCGHCNQVSNWKHVIQRHCRLKHNGDVKVVLSSRNNISKTSSACGINSSNHIKCSKCPFTATEKSIYENHLKQHSITPETIFKCFICPYYVKTETELMQHLPLHGISDPEKYGTHVLKAENVSVKRYKCSDCPYESNSKSQFIYHEQFHKVNDAPFKCEICNYQVSKRHLLHQHMKVHGLKSASQKDVEISTVEPKSAINDTEDGSVQMWVFFNGDFQKMYKCRICPYVDCKRCDVTEHEKMHNMNDSDLQKCSECHFVCDDSNSFLVHVRVHGEDYARVLCPVSHFKSDEEQIEELKEIMSELNLHKYAKSDMKKRSSDDNERVLPECKQNKKFVYFCSDCPARFSFEKELQIHYKFHCIQLPYQCSICSYTARQHGHLSAHKNVHYKDYQEKTKALLRIRVAHPEHPQPKIMAVDTFVNEPEAVWVVDSIKKSTFPKEEEDGEKNVVKKMATKQYTCTRCPAKFFKSTALNYHLTLHGGQGNFKCRQCDYAVKTIGNLAKHVVVHGDVANYEDTGYKNVPISGTDLYRHKTKAERALSERALVEPVPPVLRADPQFGLLMHGNPDFVYPTYLKNGRPKEKRYKCHKCPSAFEKREQYRVHLSLHGSKQRYKCETCDYSVKYYANYVQHVRKHQMNEDAKKRERPGEEDAKFAVKSLPKRSHGDASEPSVSDRQTLKLLHARRSSANSNKDAPEERKIYRCTYCPYANRRRDALDNHMRRHAAVSGSSGNFTCQYCDYAAPQSQFLRDHVKVHFQRSKRAAPDHFANFEGLSISIFKIGDGDGDGEPDGAIADFDETRDDDHNVRSDLVDDKIFIVPFTGERVA